MPSGDQNECMRICGRRTPSKGVYWAATLSCGSRRKSVIPPSICCANRQPWTATCETNMFVLPLLLSVYAIFSMSCQRALIPAPVKLQVLYETGIRKFHKKTSLLGRPNCSVYLFSYANKPPFREVTTSTITEAIRVFISIIITLSCLGCNRSFVIHRERCSFVVELTPIILFGFFAFGYRQTRA